MINKNVVIGSLVFVIIYDMRAYRKNKKIIARLQQERADGWKLADLYAAKLNEHRVPIDEFTKIIMNGLTK